MESNFLVSFSKSLPQKDQDYIIGQLQDCPFEFDQENEEDTEEFHYFTEYIEQEEESIEITEVILQYLSEKYKDNFSWDFGH